MSSSYPKGREMTTLSKYCTEVKFVVAVDTSIQGACVVHFVRMVKQCNVCLIGRHDHNTLVPISEAMATTSHAYLHTTTAANPYSVLLLHMTTLHSNTAKNKMYSPIQSNLDNRELANISKPFHCGTFLVKRWSTVMRCLLIS